MILFGNVEITDFDGLFNVAPQAIQQKLKDNKELRENPLHHPEENAYEHIKIVTNRLFDTGDINLILAGFFHDICKMESAEIRRKEIPYTEGLVSIEDIIVHSKNITTRLTQGDAINHILTDFLNVICKKEDDTASTREIAYEDGLISITEVVSEWMLCRDHEKKAVDFALRHVTWMHQFEPAIDLGKIIWIINEHMRVKVVNDMGGRKKKEMTENKWFKDLVVFSKADRMLIEWNYPLLQLKLDVYRKDPELLIPSIDLLKFLQKEKAD